MAMEGDSAPGVLRRTVGALRRVPVVVVVALALLVGVPLLLRSTDSPQERTEVSRSPDAPVVTASVEERVLRDAVLLSGQVVSAETFEVALPQGAGGDGGAARPVVTTAAPEVGTVVDAGALLVAVSGHPVFLLQGELPLYRTIRPGDTGPDVEALQRGLAGAGYGVEVDGTYGRRTWNAIDELWRAHGFEPVVDETVAAQIDAAADALDDLRAQNDAAIAAAQAAGAPAPDMSAQLAAAERQLGELRAGFGPIVVPESFVIAPVVPATVVASRARLGDDLAGGGAGPAPDSQGAGPQGGNSGALLELSASAPVVTVEATAAQASMLTPGLMATMTIGDSEVTAPIDAIGEVGAAGTARVVVRPDPALSLDLLGTPVTAEIEITSSGEPVLAVPASALRSSPNQPEHVVRVTGGDGRDPEDREVVAVETGAVVGGWVEVSSSRPGLAAGDQVIVGG